MGANCCMLQFQLLLGISNTILQNRKNSLILGQARRIVDLADARFATAFAEIREIRRYSQQRKKSDCLPRGGCVSHDVTADGLLGVGIEHCHAAVYLGDNLVGDHDHDAKLHYRHKECVENNEQHNERKCESKQR